jgi:hypothetical protein
MDSSNPSLIRPGSFKAGATVELVSPTAGEIKGWDKKDWGRPVKVDRTLMRHKPQTTTLSFCPAAR